MDTMVLGADVIGVAKTDYLEGNTTGITIVWTDVPDACAKFTQWHKKLREYLELAYGNPNGAGEWMNTADREILPEHYWIASVGLSASDENSLVSDHCLSVADCSGLFLVNEHRWYNDWTEKPVVVHNENLPMESVWEWYSDGSDDYFEVGELDFDDGLMSGTGSAEIWSDGWISMFAKNARRCTSLEAVITESWSKTGI